MTLLNIGAVLLSDPSTDKILLLKRNKLPYKDYWAFPGGKLEVGETLRECALREFEEETGIQLRSIKLDSILNEQLRENNIITMQFVVYYWISEDGSDFEQTNRDTKEGKLHWFNFANLPNNIIPSDYEILKNYLETRQNNRNSNHPTMIEGILHYENSSGKIILSLEKWDYNKYLN